MTRRAPVGTSGEAPAATGDKSGTNGLLWRAWPLFALAVVALNTVNTFTEIQDQPEVPWIYPAVSQATSAITAILATPIGYLAYRIAPLESRPLWRLALVHLAGLLAFTTAHVVGFYLLRRLVFRLLELPYDYDLSQRFIYELRKDAFGYALAMAALWGLSRLQAQKPSSAAPSPPATFDIRDGAKVLRVAVADILAVTSAGNYVEFVLADGRRPLMRSPLAAIEAELVQHGFVRTHRSWLVNAGRVTELRPEGSGDYAIGLGAVEAPLSRRYPDALARLRARS